MAFPPDTPDPSPTAAATVERVDGGLRVGFDLDSARPADVQIRCHGQRLCVGGVRRHLVADPGVEGGYRQVWRRFESCVELPFAVTTDRLHCDYRDNRLLVTIADPTGSA